MNTTDLERRAAELREIVARPTEQQTAAAELTRIEAELAAQHEAAATADAEKRLLGIRRAYGSLRTAYDADAESIRSAITALRQSIGKLNQRAADLAGLRAEADALAHRFGLTKPSLSVPVEPESKGGDLDLVLPPFWRHRTVRPKTETCEHGLRERRSYFEVADTAGYAIIIEAGLVAFPALSARQLEIVAEREAEQRTAAGFGQAAHQAAEEIAALPSSIPVQSMRVHRG